MLNTKRKILLDWKGYYSYFERNVQLNVPRKAGVYKLSYENSSGRLKPFYVGQAEDLNSRLYDHLQDYERNACIKRMLKSKKCFYKFALVPRKHDRDAVERALYFYYKPECNDVSRIPYAPPVIINYD